MQGKIVARDLLEKGNSVLLADLYKESAEKLLNTYPKAHFEFLDLEHIRPTVELIKKAQPKVVINCAEAEVNLNVYKSCLKTKNHVIDLGSEIPMTKEQLKYVVRSLEERNREDILRLKKFKGRVGRSRLWYNPEALLLQGYPDPPPLVER